MKKLLSLVILLTTFQLSFAQQTKVGIGTFTPEAQLHIKGDNNSGTKAVKIDNSAGSEILNVKNDGTVELTTIPATSVSNYDILTRNKITNKIEKISSVPAPESDPIWNQARVNTKTFKGNIPSGSDLNYYLETGIYNTVSDDIAANGQNYPLARLGSLEVFNYESATYQIYQSGGADNSQYIRNRNTEGWSDWRKVNSASTGLEKIENEAPYSPGWRLIGRNPDMFGNIGNGSVDFSFSSNGTHGGARGDYSFATGNNHQMLLDGSNTLATIFVSGESNIVTARPNSGLAGSSVSGYANKIGGNGYGVSAQGWMNEVESNGGATSASGYRNIGTGMASHVGGMFNYSRAQGETSLGIYGTDYTPNSNFQRIFNVGIGADYSNRKDGFTVFRDGKIKIGVEPVIDTTATKLVAWKDGILVGLDVENLKMNDVSENQEGKVNNVPLQELGGVDKMINGIRIGRGSGNGLYSAAFGEGALEENTSGWVNSAFGNYASGKNITGGYNASFGYGALYLNEHGSQNTAIGVYSLYNNQGLDWSQTRGHGSTAVGSQSMYSNVDGNGTAVGYHSLRSATTAQWNIALGFQAGSAISTGSGNTIIANTGYAGYDGISTGNNNLIIAPNNGNSTGIRTGNGNVVVGYASGLPDDAENTITLSDGVGNVTLKKQTDGTTTLPNLTDVLIDAETTGQSAVTKKWVLGQKKYKSFVATISQSGTDNPTVNVLENELGADLTLERVGIGVYSGGFSLPVLTENKTMILLGNNTDNVVQQVTSYNESTSDLMIQKIIRAGGGAPVKTDELKKISLEIRVYN